MITDYYKDLTAYDYETPTGCFLASFYFPREDKFCDFLINQYQNDLYKFIRFYEENKRKLFLGFNCINFDAQITEFIFDNYEMWYDKTGLEISALISQFGSDIIDDQEYNVYLPYREEYFRFKQLDIPRVFHWFNENKRVGLKQAEFELRATTIENFDIDVNKTEFSKEDVEALIYYCHNDIRYTYEIYKYAIGEVEHPLYKGKNKIYDRMVVKEEVGLECLNWDDVKIGADWNKLDYIKATGKKEWDLKPKHINVFYGKKYKQFFPSTVSFQSDELKEFIHGLGETTVLAEKQEFKYKFSDALTVTIGKGGLHSCEKPRYLHPEDDEIFLQNDIGSQYPNALRKYGKYPKHLSKVWIDSIEQKIQRRLKNKKLYKETKDPKYNSLQEMGKLQLNGGLYGRLNTKGDWQQDPCVMLNVTIGCQLEILMIVEALILKSFNVTSCNTDGWDCIIPKNRLDEYFEIVEYYEELIGNKELGNIEFTEFEWMAQTSVNDYMAKKKGIWENREFKPDTIVTRESHYPTLKLKGDFTVDFLLEKNSSFRIIPLAIVEYFYAHCNIEEFITSHKDIFDFCARSNSGKTYYHLGYKNNEEFKIPKLIRYYVSKEGIHIKKIVKDNIDTGANDQNVQPAEYLKTICNTLREEDYNTHLENVNFGWYIDKVREMIFLVENGKTAKRTKIDKNQLSLF